MPNLMPLTFLIDVRDQESVIYRQGVNCRRPTEVIDALRDAIRKIEEYQLPSTEHFFEKVQP